MTVISTRTDYRAVNGRGVDVRSFGAADLAVRWVEGNAAAHDGLHVEVVVSSERRRAL